MTDTTLSDRPTPAQILRTISVSQEVRTAVLGLSAIGTAILFGWRMREQAYLNPETGIGYALGIIGLSMMILLLLYPVRKRVRRARNWGRVKLWFQAHMLFGVIGPLCILYHCNFQLGSTNSNVSLFSMLLVSGSGIFGRYFYTRIHYGLYGRIAKVSELTSAQAYAEAQMHDVFTLAPQLKTRVERISDTTNRWPLQFITGGLLMYGRYLALQPALKRAYRIAGERNRWTEETRHHKLSAANSHLRTFLAASRKAHEFGLYQRLFSLWHVLHVPLFVMLALSATVHVIAVHMY